MSVEDLERLIGKTVIEPPLIAEPSSIDELVTKRDDVNVERSFKIAERTIELTKKIQL